jgi:hypothetical protein
MIICDSCKKEIKEREIMFECLESIVIDEDTSELYQNAKIERYCVKCFNKKRI